MGNWEFRLNELGTWYWHCVEPANETVLERSEHDFSTLFLCVRDAEKHGYKLKTPGMHY